MCLINALLGENGKVDDVSNDVAEDVVRIGLFTS